MGRLSWIAALVWLLDQLSKYAALKFLGLHAALEVTPFLNLTLAFNTGAAFSFLSDAGGWQNLLFAAIAALVSVVILFMVRRLTPADRQVAVALLLILGGALGNLTDRLVHGHVVDFLDLHYAGWHWPIFNLADSAITVGAVLLVLDTFGLRLGRRSA